MATTTALITVEEFLRLPELEGEKLELIHGEVISMPLSGLPHEVTKSNLIMLLTPWAVQNSGLRVFCESACQVDETNILIPDISLVASKRIVPGSRGVLQGAPELAVEVISSETADRLEDKIEQYFSNGSKSVWVVYPKTRTVRIFDVSGGAKRYVRDQPLVDPPVLPGFSAPTSAIFEDV